ncbi:Endonuclease/exonuclease/phosphatase [Jimgerdemannia flammicorona]|uniref:Endonuclease/exonuclease/phosphatase n=2 Tax=Jimgerdemannia flammicorona TaxID=994334 RepID=A0A433DFZ1_9FUNG|nr:Endonuclease/exonuclease/phosphatase [Jimgerdemannia flammicorona]RUS34780.1 Endonuclease/exonuclease/phosphatase [Jimgerdemannia flammicorona]
MTATTSTIYPDMTTTTSARFLTLNIFIRPPFIKNNLSDYKDSRLKYFIRYVLPRYDVVALQEAFAFGSIRKDILICKARKMGFNYHIESMRKNICDWSIDGGLLILSKFKIVDSAKLEYERGVHSDWFAAKGALHARLELNPSTHLDLFTTHTQASYGPPPPTLTDSATKVRFRQFSKLHDFIAFRANLPTGASSPVIPILLAGDLNVDASQHVPPPTQPSSGASEEYEAMMKVLRGDSIEDLPASERRIPLLVDSVREQLGYHPVTYGDVQLGPDGVIEPAETVLTAKMDQGTVQSLDRLLFCEAAEVEGEAEGERKQQGLAEGEVRQERYRIRIAKTAVEKFLVKDEKDVTDILPFTQVSDHYGISAVIELSFV